MLIEGMKGKVDKFEEVWQENDKNSKLHQDCLIGIIDENWNTIDKNNEEDMMVK